ARFALAQSALLIASIAGLSACASSGVGDPCIPENVPLNNDTGERGFVPDEVYIETGSVQCRTRVCLTFQLDGDPTSTRDECIAAGNPPDVCADRHPIIEDIRGETSRVFCSCRCDRPTPDGAPPCECPGGFVCSEESNLEQGGPGIRGSYCIRESLVTTTGG
ncbi:MAG: hypothetical protein AAF938_28955, partial [Myxococcota bacterium]